MLVFDPNIRINANEALHHAYFNEYRRDYMFSGLNHFSLSMDHGDEQQQSAPVFGLNQIQTLPSENTRNDSRRSSSSILTSSSSEDRIGSNFISPATNSNLTLPLTQ